MLVLTRKLGQRIFIGDGIEIVVVGVRGKRVRLGFVAPSDMSIHRQESLDRQEAAARAGLVEPDSLPTGTK